MVFDQKGMMKENFILGLYYESATLKMKKEEERERERKKESKVKTLEMI